MSRYSEVVLSDNPVLYHRLGGRLKDEHGEFGLFPASSHNQGVVPALIYGSSENGATWFKTSSDGYQILADSRLDLTNNFSVEAWIYCMKDTGGVYEKSVAEIVNTSHLMFHESNTGVPACPKFRVIQAAALKTAQGTTTLMDGTVHYLVATVEDTVVSIYDNSGLVGSTPKTSGPIDGGSGRSYIGRLAQGVYVNESIIDEVAVYDYVLSRAQMRYHELVGRSALGTETVQTYADLLRESKMPDPVAVGQPDTNRWGR